jgi:hypothetical protein
MKLNAANRWAFMAAALGSLSWCVAGIPMIEL